MNLCAERQYIFSPGATQVLRKSFTVVTFLEQAGRFTPFSSTTEPMNWQQPHYRPSISFVLLTLAMLLVHRCANLPTQPANSNTAGAPTPVATFTATAEPPAEPGGPALPTVTPIPAADNNSSLL